MKYRALDSLGDYTVGRPFLVNSPGAVAQAIGTRLKLWRGEWFVDLSDGTPYNEDVLGKRSNRNPESAIKQRILATPGVTAITTFSSSFDGDSRLLTINATVDTLYGPVTVSEVL
jgi:hypothetical protein